MVNRIHVMLAALGVTAAISVLAMADTVGNLGLAKNVASILGVSTIGSIPDDFDNDGLSNTDESYWQTDFQNADTDGDKFLDGEEIASGHDPLIPGPNDLLVKQDNLTARFADLTLSGLYEGTLRSDNPDRDSSLNRLATIIAEDGISNLTKQSDGPRTFPVVQENSKEAQEQYIKNMQRAIKPFFATYSTQLYGAEDMLNRIGAEGVEHPDILRYFSEHSAAMDAALDQLFSVSVPSSWSSEHTQLLNVLEEVARANRYLSETNNDPIQSTIALSKIIERAETLGNVTGMYDAKIASLGLNVK